ncbi:MAG: class I SAM-dependent methyltransferase [Spirochaetales bacterium]|nr:class I SAM-dependent methyltransferase [Spirochaetales bacterium]
MPDHEDIIRRHYVPRIKRYDEHHKILDWESGTAQTSRFDVLIRNVDLSNASLLDVGCGIGDLWGYCRDLGIACDYTGIDILGEMVELAQAAYPDARFIHGDMFKQDIFQPDSFDVVFTSGIFNLNIGNNMQFLKEAVELLLKVSRRAVVFNMLHIKSPAKEDLYSYHDPAEIGYFLERFGCTPVIIEDYLGNDFTVICSVPHG